MALSKHFSTIIVRNVPKLSMERRDVLRRFILMIDEFYYQSRKVVIEAETKLEELFERSKNKSNLDEEFAFERTLSRLKEM